MNAKEIIEMLKEFKLWVSLTEKEKQEAIKYVLEKYPNFDHKGRNKDYCW